MLSITLNYSDLNQHKKAISTAQKALKSIVYIFYQTQIIVLFYLVKELNKSENEDSPKNIKEYLNINAILQFVLDKVLTRFSFDQKKNPYINYIEALLKIVKSLSKDIDFNVEPDLEFLNRKSITQESYLIESTILSLSHLNYFNFSDVFVTPKMKNEIMDISIMEKIVFLVLALYVVATEYRFIEH